MPPYKRKFIAQAGFVPYKKPFAPRTSRQLSVRMSNASHMRSIQAKGESNYVDVANAAYQNDTTGSITLLNTVAQGTTVNQRVGKKFMMQSLQIKGTTRAKGTTTETQADNLLVYDKRPGGALPNITDILVTANSNSFNNDNNTSRFRILRRWHNVLIGNVTTPATGKEAIDFDHFVPLKLGVVNNALGTGAIDDIDEGALYFVTIGTNAAGTTAAETAYSFRLRFKDM